MNDYIRYPSNWERQSQVFHILDNYTSNNVEVTVACRPSIKHLLYSRFNKVEIKSRFQKN